MRRFVALGGLLLLVASFCGCGSDEAATNVEATTTAKATTTVTASKGLFGTITYAGDRTEPVIHVSGGPPPKKTFVRDVKVGNGPAARKGNTVAVYYHGVNYRTGVKVHYSWGPGSPFEITLNAVTAWEKSILGMRAGGVREAVIPSRLAFHEGAIDYITSLVSVRPPQ
jgi:FKBP-type peptidyl-prolyl cis-trans isomerase